MNGAYPFGSVGSANAHAARCIGWKEPSNARIRPPAKSAASRSGPDARCSSASPLNTACGAPPTVSADVLGDRVGFQAVIVPASLANTKKAGEPFDSTKSVVSLNTCPVGAPPGIETTSGTMVGEPPGGSV